MQRRLPPDDRTRLSTYLMGAVVIVALALIAAFVLIVLTGHGRIVIELVAMLVSGTSGYGLGRRRQSN